MQFDWVIDFKIYNWIYEHYNIETGINNDIIIGSQKRTLRILIYGCMFKYMLSKYIDFYSDINYSQVIA
jgi:hypothetical protein